MSHERNQEQHELEAAGWRSEDRGGETVWQNPESGFWYPQGVAVAMLREGAKTDVPLKPEGGTWSSREASTERGSDRRPYDDPGSP